MKVPIINIVIDDGTGSIPVVGFRDRAEQITKAKSEEIIDLTEDIDMYRNFSKKMIGSEIELAGNVSLNNMTGEKQLIANQVIGVKLKTVYTSDSGSGSKSDSGKVAGDEVIDAEKIDMDDIDVEEIDIDDDLL